MPFIRLSDNYIDHPKISALSDGAFRLWHECLAFCRKHQTDGLIPKKNMLQCHSYRSKRLDELLRPWMEGANPLAVLIPSFGFKIHDYLEWNLSKEEADDDRDQARLRMRRLRGGRSPVVTPPCSREQVGERSPLVPDREGLDLRSSERERERKPEATDRAARLLDTYKQVWYPKYRHGARLKLIHSPLEQGDAIVLCDTWDDAHLEKLAKIVLTTNDDFISGTDRSFKIFALKASWADNRLKEAESGAA